MKCERKKGGGGEERAALRPDGPTKWSVYGAKLCKKRIKKKKKKGILAWKKCVM